MKRIMAVYDEDSCYAERFAEFANHKELTPFMAVAFTSLERLKTFSQKQKVELLLIGHTVSAQALAEIKAGQIIWLGGIGETRVDDNPVVHKYQASDHVLREVMTCYRTEPEQLVYMQTGLAGSIIGVYSPVSRCGKTSFALTMGQIMARESRVLFISLEESSGLSWLLGIEHKTSLSDLIYYYRQGDLGRERLKAVTYRLNEMDYIPPVTYAEDLAQISCEDVAGILTGISKSGGYDVILVDFGQYGKGIERLFELCRQIYVPTLSDGISKAKLEEWSAYLELSGRMPEENRLQLIRLPWSQAQPTPAEGYLEQLLWSEVGDYVRSLLGGRREGWEA